jgi:hypothetical protein
MTNLNDRLVNAITANGELQARVDGLEARVKAYDKLLDAIEYYADENDLEFNENLANDRQRIAALGGEK